MSAGKNNNFYYEFSCGMQWNVEDWLCDFERYHDQYIIPSSVCIMHAVCNDMAVVSTVTLRYCYSEDGDRFCGILSLEDHSVYLYVHENVILRLTDNMEICKWQ
jgi:hypothetical protein